MNSGSSIDHSNAGITFSDHHNNNEVAASLSGDVAQKDYENTHHMKIIRKCSVDKLVNMNKGRNVFICIGILFF